MNVAGRRGNFSPSPTLGSRLPGNHLFYERNYLGGKLNSLLRFG